MAEASITYFEDLKIVGQICPPPDAIYPDGKKEYYRVVKSNPANSECFISHRAKFPEMVFDDECVARAISLSDSIGSIINGYFKTPARKKKNRLIGIVRLQPSDGLIKQTGVVGHHSWWRSKTFDVSSVIIQQVEI